MLHIVKRVREFVAEDPSTVAIIVGAAVILMTAIFVAGWVRDWTWLVLVLLFALLTVAKGAQALVARRLAIESHRIEEGGSNG